MKEYLNSKGLPDHSPHKFRHGHIKYGTSHAKAISMNVMHASMEITDEFNSNMNDNELENRITQLTQQNTVSEGNEIEIFKQFIEWKMSL